MKRLISAAKEPRVWRASNDEIIEIAEQLSPNSSDFMMSLEKGDLIVQEAFVYLDQYDAAKKHHVLHLCKLIKAMIQVKTGAPLDLTFEVHHKTFLNNYDETGKITGWYETYADYDMVTRVIRVSQRENLTCKDIRDSTLHEICHQLTYKILNDNSIDDHGNVVDITVRFKKKHLKQNIFFSGLEFVEVFNRQPFGPFQFFFLSVFGNSQVLIFF